MARAESGSITQLGKNRWRVRVSGGNDPVTGKRIRLSKVVHGSKKDAIAERTRMQVEVGQIDRATKGMTVAQYIDDVFMPWHKSEVRETSYVTTKRRMKRVREALGHIQLTKLSAYTVETWMNTIESQTMRREAFGALRNAYNQAYRWGLVQNNIFDKIEPPKRPKSVKVVADAELAALIIGSMFGERVEAPFLLEIGCGLRLSESMALDWEDIDFKTGKVYICKTYQYVPHKGPMFFDTKTTKSTRTVTIPRNILDRLFEIRCEGGIVRFGPLAIGDDGNRMHPSSFRYRYEKIWKEKLSDYEYVCLKNLRHSHATILLASGVDIKTIADRLGHANIHTTASFYLQPVEELDKQASDVFSESVKIAGSREKQAAIVELKPAKEA